MEFQMRVSAAMTRADEYKAKAEEAERQASKATSDVERTAYWRIAQGWRDLEAAARASRKRGV